MDSVSHTLEAMHRRTEGVIALVWRERSLPVTRDISRFGEITARYGVSNFVDVGEWPAPSYVEICFGRGRNEKRRKLARSVILSDNFLIRTFFSTNPGIYITTCLYNVQIYNSNVQGRNGKHCLPICTPQSFALSSFANATSRSSARFALSTSSDAS